MKIGKAVWWVRQAVLGTLVKKSKLVRLLGEGLLDNQSWTVRRLPETLSSTSFPYRISGPIAVLHGLRSLRYWLIEDVHSKKNGSFPAVVTLTFWAGAHKWPA